MRLISWFNVFKSDIWYIFVSSFWFLLIQRPIESDFLEKPEFIILVGTSSATKIKLTDPSYESCISIVTGVFTVYPKSTFVK